VYADFAIPEAFSEFWRPEGTRTRRQSNRGDWNCLPRFAEQR